MQSNRSIFINSMRVAGLIWLSISLCCSPSCKKADHYAQLINEQPFLVTTGNYQTSYLVGDTATFIGRFFIGQPGSSILIGNANPSIVSQTKVSNFDANAYTHQPDSLDVIKFIITAAMGIGNRIPVYITAHGVTITGPPLSIQQFKGVQQKTDTTLFVDSLGGFLPADVNFYLNNGLPLVQNMNVSGNGVLCFNNLTGVYLVNNGQTSSLLQTGTMLQENGIPFTIQLFLGAAITFKGDSLYFSAQVSENTPDTATAYIFRLCRLNISAGTVTTLNRTEVQKGLATANETPGPYEHSISALKVVAANLKMDINGSLYYVNYYSPARVDHDNTATWYQGEGINMGIPSAVPFISGDPDVYVNICRMDDGGNVRSLFSENLTVIGGNPPLYTIPGYPVLFATDYLASLDGNGALIGNNQFMNTQLPSIGYFDLQQSILLGSQINSYQHPSIIRFNSYDTSSVTGYAAGVAQSQGGAIVGYANFNFGVPCCGIPGTYMVNNLLLPGGYIVYQQGSSLQAVNLQNNSAYCYAGTEAGLVSGFMPPAVQYQTTGHAKDVNFGSYGGIFFADGGDNSNGIYYYTGWMDYVNGLHFYKLYPKK